MLETTEVRTDSVRENWRAMVEEYQKPETGKSVWQIINSFVPFVVLWYLMYLSLDVSYFLTVLLAIPVAGLTFRIFIIQHDCGHGSFFASRKANDVLGSICGVVTLTPYFYWRKHHAIHHANSGKLDDARGIGEIYTMTVQEYAALPWWKRLGYRIYRNPFFLFVLVPTLLFTVMYRFYHPFLAKKWKRERNSVIWTDLAILALVIVLSLMIGFRQFLLVQIPITIIASTLGVWFFYVQHQFEEAYFAQVGDWEYSDAALHGSSFFKLPKVVQWFSGNIGFHHIHHLSPRIPNYKLEECHEENEKLQEVYEISMISSFRSIPLALWDEESKELISFRQFKQMQKEKPAQQKQSILSVYDPTPKPIQNSDS
jgi:omega-6 fatty acid desaturase (delta-12 desaturase)